MRRFPLPPIDRNDEIHYISLGEKEKKRDAWKYQGYPGLAVWMASSNDAFILRKFSKLSARSLLYLQYEISQREKELDDHDLWSMKQPHGQGGCDSFDLDGDGDRAQLLFELMSRLERYYNLVNAFAEVNARPDAKDYHRRNLKNWLETWPNAIQQDEQHLFDPKNEGDLFPIEYRPRTPLKALLEKTTFFKSLFKARPTSSHIKSDSTRYHSDANLDSFAGILIVAVGLIMLLGPLWWLNYVSRDVYRLGIITVFVSIFAAWLWMAAGNRSFEILAGTAAYAAVLIVYLQIQKSG